MSVDPAQVDAIIREVSCAEILPRFRNLEAGQIREKQPGQVVTEADIEAERELTRRLTDLLPGAAVVGEEGVALDPASMALLDLPGAVWVIDPIDGTANYAKGRARFAVIVALVVAGETRMGWIHDPISDRSVIAQAGGGAWLDGTRLHVSIDGPVDRMSGSVKRSMALAGRVARIGRQGSAAHDYLDLVTGVLDFAHFRRLMPWDHAAGVLIHAEAGGFGRMTDGRPYRPGPSEGSLLLAPGEHSWATLRPLVD
jgi:fructose-1,6-bisphosphatase/inositol monophosphatase family enzyme